MTDEQINIAIAEHCGFNLEEYRMEEGGINVAAIPDYCNDLNDMHDAEKELYANEQDDYWNELWNLCGSEFGICHATSRQRAEAFLKTIGKWEEQ
jgi:hypothetical protein